MNYPSFPCVGAHGQSFPTFAHHSVHRGGRCETRRGLIEDRCLPFDGIRPWHGGLREDWARGVTRTLLPIAAALAAREHDRTGTSTSDGASRRAPHVLRQKQCPVRGRV